MIVTFQTDTAISGRYFVKPEWEGDISDLVVLKVNRKDAPDVLLQLKEWVRQLESETVMISDV